MSDRCRGWDYCSLNRVRVEGGWWVSWYGGGLGMAGGPGSREAGRERVLYVAR